ncbi:hypothetical protein ABE021_07845 [Sporosarcina gallistercoris]|uniref:hypothetical protein n=1 Tax=Sporosarcina gallistercoris TaxID=2762245 RepID=UPI003D297F6B
MESTTQATLRGEAGMIAYSGEVSWFAIGLPEEEIIPAEAPCQVAYRAKLRNE